MSPSQVLEYSAAIERFALHATLVALLVAGLSPVALSAGAQIAGTNASDADFGVIPLYLEVFINGHDHKVIAPFHLHPNGRFSAATDDLEHLGIKISKGMEGEVYLDTLPGLNVRYDEARQVIEFAATDDALIPNQIAAGEKQDFVLATPGFGAVLNYGAFATTGETLWNGNFTPQIASLMLDGRIFTPYGVLTSTGVARTAGPSINGASLLRYDTTWSFDDQNSMLSYAVGDVISSAPPWARSIRMGGVQVRRDFSLRDDVITRPLLNASGSAAVLSTVDVYIDNIKTFSSDVQPGPFTLTDVPLITGHGDAVIVLRDPSGRETKTTLPFYSSPDLLRRGMFDFSVETGLARQHVGQESFDYAPDALASASARFGLTDSITLEGHGEAKDNLISGGAGVTTALFDRAEVSAAGGGSVYNGKMGYFAYGRIRTALAGLTFDVSSLRSFGSFADLAYVTGIEALGLGTVTNTYNYLEPPRALDVASVSIPIKFDNSSLSLNVIHSQHSTTEDTILSASYGRNLHWYDAAFNISVFKDFGSRDGLGAMVGFSMPLGDGRYGNVGAQRSSGGKISPEVEISRPVGSKIGSYGYAIAADGTDLNGNLRASASYRSTYGLARAELRNSQKKAAADFSFDGSLVMADGSIFAANTIDDGFAIANVGFPNVPVLLQNRPVAVTGNNGKALVTNLKSYSPNKLSIDVSSLPVDASVNLTDQQVVPARRSGVTVTFNGGIKNAALLVMRNAAGHVLRPGASATLLGSGTQATVGYDGELWIEGLAPSNTLTVVSDGTTCSASFDYIPQPGKQVTIDPVICK